MAPMMTRPVLLLLSCVIPAMMSVTIELNSCLRQHYPPIPPINESHSVVTTSPSSYAECGPASVFGGVFVPDSAWHEESTGVWTTDVTAVLASAGISNPDDVHNVWLNGNPLARVRTELLTFESAIDPHNLNAEVNHHGFVYSPTTFPPSWLNNASMSHWLVVAFHQWATDVHTVAGVDTANRTLWLNQPTYEKYGFGTQEAGGRRFYVENVPELPVTLGTFRFQVVDGGNATISVGSATRPLPNSVVIPSHLTLLSVDTAQNVSISNLLFDVTAWALTPPPPSSSPSSSDQIGGSGPLPYRSAAINIASSQNVSLSNVRISSAGADGILVSKSSSVSVRNSTVFRVGGHAVYVYASANVTIQDSSLRGMGRTWRQGTGVEFSDSDGSIVYNDIGNGASDGIMIGGVRPSPVTVAHNWIHDLGDPVSNETISDFGGIHTALPNASSTSIIVHNNVVARSAGFALGGFGLYFDYSTSGAIVTSNLVYDTGAGPMFVNSNGNLHGTGTNVFDNNLFIARRTRPMDGNVVMKFRSWVSSTKWTRNIIVSQFGGGSDTNSSNNHSDDAVATPELYQTNADVPNQMDGTLFDNNVMFDANNKSSTFGSTWPKGLTWAEWQATGQDVHSVVADPQFVNLSADNFTLLPSSPALALGFVPWDYNDVGPRVTFSAPYSFITNHKIY